LKRKRSGPRCGQSGPAAVGIFTETGQASASTSDSCPRNQTDAQIVQLHPVMVIIRRNCATTSTRAARGVMNLLPP
jgi:hypothetical protein